MAINSDNSFDIGVEGLAIRDDNGTVIFYLATGSGDPTGSSAPVNTIYFDRLSQLIWQKFGTGNNDWSTLRAADISFNNNSSTITSNTVQEALEELAGSSNLTRIINPDDEITIKFEQVAFATNLVILANSTSCGILNVQGELTLI